MLGQLAAAKLPAEMHRALTEIAPSMSAAAFSWRIDHARKVNSVIVAATASMRDSDRSARIAGIGAQFVRSATPLALVRSVLLELTASNDPELITCLPASGAQRGSMKTEAIYAKRNGKDQP